MKLSRVLDRNVKTLGVFRLEEKRYEDLLFDKLSFPKEVWRK